MVNLLWGLGTSVTNAYVLYKYTFQKARAKKIKLSITQLNHREFIEELALSLMSNSNIELPPSVNIAEQTTAPPNLTDTIQRTRHEEILKTRATLMNASSLNEKFPHRLDGMYHPFVPSKIMTLCQICIRNGKEWEKNLSRQERKVYDRKLKRKKGLNKLRTRDIIIV